MPSGKNATLTPKHPGGRPSNYKAEYAEQAYKVCLLGATDKDLASFFNVSEQTINSWKEKHVEFLESLKRGKTEADAVIASKLFHRAKGYDHPDIITASCQGVITDIKTVTKYYPPDTTAAIFWLKNRQPSKWRDKADIEHTGKDGGPIEVKEISLEEKLKLIESIKNL